MLCRYSLATLRLLIIIGLLAVVPVGLGSAQAAPSPPSTTSTAPADRLPGDLLPPTPPSTAHSAPTELAPTLPAPSFDPAVAGPFSTAGQFGSRNEAYLQMLAARSRAASLAPLLTDGASGLQARAEFLRSALSGFQAQMDLAERAGVGGIGSLSASTSSAPTGAAMPGAAGGRRDLRLTVPSLGLSAGALPALPGLPSLSDSTEGSAPAGFQLAASLLRMPSLADASGGRAIDPAAFIAGRAGVVDSCRAAITARASAAAITGGRPGEAGWCAGTPVGIAYQQGPQFDPNAYRAQLEQLAAGPPQSLLDRHHSNQDKAAAPPAPPKLPPELTQSSSQCRTLNHNLSSAGAQYFPPAAMANNLLEHLCLLAWN